jgi:hypothetical protein
MNPMKRSEINQIMTQAVLFFQKQNFYLPEFAFWSMEKWMSMGNKIEKLMKNKLGWDITDYGSGNFHKTGLVHFTIRNGNTEEFKKQDIPYCEKIMIIEEEQHLPIHHHKDKIEDIINRGGGTLEIELYSIAEDGSLGEKKLEVFTDGIKRVINSGEKIVLSPGQSVTITPELFHKFRARKGGGKVLVGEVSSVNDDYGDNIYLNNVKRFMEIEEDESPLYLLCQDYENYINL